MESSILPPKFPTLKLAVDQGALSAIDYEFAKMLLKEHDLVEETVAGLICHLAKASREGHLCVVYKDGRLFPSPDQLWLKDCNCEPSEELLKLISTIGSAFERIPSTLLSIVENGLKDYPLQPICLYRNALYLQKNWVFETHFIEHLRELRDQKPSLKVDMSRVKTLLSRYSLNQNQQLAVEHAFQNSLTLISGGPGTGKTYTAGCFAALYLECFGEKLPKIAITAPTGKAASKLRSELMSLDYSQIETLTLHSLLNFSPNTPYSYPPRKLLPYDLLLVDECSMIDVKLMASLLPAIKKGARVVFLGDPDQLPSVEAGSLFADMMIALDERYQVQLQECLRVELRDLVHFAGLINRGIFKELPSCVNIIQGNADTSSGKKHEFMRFLEGFLPSDYSLEAVINRFDRFRLLSPLRKGGFGVDQLNEAVLNVVFHQVQEESDYAVPIMITRNDKRSGLFNGETGFLVRKKGKHPFEVSKGDYALFGGRKIDAFLLPSFEYAFCLSVHKSQGSEFDHVMLILPKGSERFGREMLYTAVTRAKKRLTIFGSEHVLKEAVKYRSHRISGVVKRLTA